MGFAGFPDEAFEFYQGLVADNSRSYWTANKRTYEDAVRTPIRALLEALAPEFGGAVSIFRPHRDIRFARDKSPYKTHQGGFLEVAPGVGYYVQVDASGLLLGGGFHAHDRAHTARYRAAVDDESTGPALALLVAELENSGFTIEGDQVRTRPRGVPPDHPRLDLMRREFLTATRRPDPATTRTPTAVATHWHHLRPLVDWIITNAPPSTVDSPQRS